MKSQIEWSSHFTYIFGNEVNRIFIQIILNSEKVEKLNGVVILPIFLFISGTKFETNCHIRIYNGIYIGNIYIVWKMINFRHSNV